MIIEYAYPWNKPRAAIASPYLTYKEIHRRDQLIAAEAHLARQPSLVRQNVNRRVNELKKSHGVLRGNAYLTKSFFGRALPRLELVADKYRLQITASPSTEELLPDVPRASSAIHDVQLVILMRRFNRLPDMSRSDIDLLAGDISNFITSELIQVNSEIGEVSEYRALWCLYRTAAKITRVLGQAAPAWDKVTTRFFSEDDAAPAIHKMKAERWWKNLLRRIAAEWREHLHIALANVSKKHTPYASNMAVYEWREQKRRTREFLKGMELEDEDGNRISLIDKFDGSIANPAIRRCELMTRIRGFENICNQLGYVGQFYTLTTPSKYHATTKSGYHNRKWNGASPAATQAYLCGVWQKIRAKLHREELRIFGIRVAEPHHDGTPHWHMLMFMRPEDAARVTAIIRSYAYNEDAAELKSDKAKKARFHAEAIDPDKGSATGYVAKYISKNIDGYALDGELDDETNKPIKETAGAVSAWAARWRIRQFQFVGGAPVTVYRELRRMADSETAQGLSVEFAAAHDAADIGDWAAYVNAQGGPFVRRDELAVRTWYQPAAQLNEYTEETFKIQGVYATAVGADTPILTRLKQWKIVAKRAVDLAVDLKDASASSRSSVNNCTGQQTEPQEIDFNKPPSRAERRRILARIRSKDTVKSGEPPLTHPGNSDARLKLREMVKDISDIVLTESEITRMMGGGKVTVNGQPYFSGPAGNLYQAARASENPLKNFRLLAKKVTDKANRMKNRHSD
ncbi:hypothetical protein J2125_000185 [Erwinia toletana]|uniref:Replication gene A protein-like domain-containing protein n=1 Tax=Winslowiella toletana TaxID=92490 RepID=A0ABS4P4W2_9GAMM|nr:replication endonuclease [Winslowiella toletana]MBP2166993.1 hypothetical protein [Winslowiella toletana]